MGGTKLSKLWYLLFHSPTPIQIVLLVDVILAGWLIWSLAVLRSDKASRPTWKSILAQAPFWGWLGWFVVQSLNSFIRSLPGWLPAH